MSRSRPQLKNPAQQFMEFKGGAEPIGKDEQGFMQYEGGRIQYWDKQANDGEGASVEVPMPFTFLVLDQLTTITGFSKALNSGFYSNEVKDMNKQELVVRNKNGIVARGLYKNIKDELKAQGAKYTTSVYIAFFNDEKELVIGHFKFVGSSLNAWIELGKRIDVEQAALIMTVNPEVKTNGTTKYFEPSFESIKVSEATGKLADKLDIQLQSYLDAYFARGPETDSIMTEEEERDAEENAEENERRADAAAAEAAKVAPEATQAAPAAETLEDGTSTDAEQPAPQKPANKPATAAKAKEDNIKLNDVEF